MCARKRALCTDTRLRGKAEFSQPRTKKRKGGGKGEDEDAQARGRVKPALQKREIGTRTISCADYRGERDAERGGKKKKKKGCHGNKTSEERPAHATPKASRTCCNRPGLASEKKNKNKEKKKKKPARRGSKIGYQGGRGEKLKKQKRRGEDVGGNLKGGKGGGGGQGLKRSAASLQLQY